MQGTRLNAHTSEREKRDKGQTSTQRKLPLTAQRGALTFDHQGIARCPDLSRSLSRKEYRLALLELKMNPEPRGEGRVRKGEEKLKREKRER